MIMEEIDSENLIPLIEARPALYDKKLKTYSDRQIKQKLWVEICEGMVTGWAQLTSEEKTQMGMKIQKRWQNLRTCFKKEYNAQRDVKSGQSAQKRKKYEFYDQLLFLLPTITERPTVSSTDHRQEPNSPAASSSNIDSPTAVVSPTPTDTSRSIVRPSDPRNKNASKQKKSYEDRLLQILDDKRKEAIDEDTHFLLSLVPSFQRMNNSQKLKVKMQFLQALSDIENPEAQHPNMLSQPGPVRQFHANIRHLSSPVYENVYRYNLHSPSSRSPQSPHSMVSDDYEAIHGGHRVSVPVPVLQGSPNELPPVSPQITMQGTQQVEPSVQESPNSTEDDILDLGLANFVSRFT